jgi:hypothetical protein
MTCWLRLSLQMVLSSMNLPTMVGNDVINAAVRCVAKCRAKAPACLTAPRPGAERRDNPAAYC